MSTLTPWPARVEGQWAEGRGWGPWLYEDGAASPFGVGLGTYWVELCRVVRLLVVGAAAWSLAVSLKALIPRPSGLQERGLSFAECSAALGHNILEPMVSLAR